MGEGFDPEKVGRHDYYCDENCMNRRRDDAVFVLASDYDQLLALYQGTEKSRAAAMRQIKRLTDTLHRDEWSVYKQN